MAVNVAPIMQLVNRQLINDTALAAEISGRVFGGHAEANDQTMWPRPYVVVEFRRARTSPANVYQELVLELWVFSDQSAAQAFAIYDLARAALYRVSLSHADIDAVAVCRDTSGPHMGWNEQSRCHVARGLWLCQAGGGA